jgi:hypothetical protein
MRRHLSALCALIVTLVALPALAGIRYTADTTSTGANANQKMRVEGWIDGAGAKIVFSEAGTPLIQQGSYIVTRDAGQTIFLVDPEEKTYAEWDLEAMLAGLGSMMEAMGGMIDMQVDNVETENIDSGSGPEMHGLATDYRKFKISYDMRIQVMGMKRNNHVDTVNEVWSTSALDDAALGVWLRDAPTTGFQAVDELIEAQAEQAKGGFPLKTVTTTTTTGPKGKRSDTTTSTMVVTSLDRSASIPAGTFEVPQGYERVEAPAAGGEQADNPLKGLFGGNR